MRKELSTSYSSKDGVMRDFCDGEFFKNHPIVRRYENPLCFIIYYDDIEVGNALGPKAGRHKLGMCAYIMLYSHII